MLFSLQRMLTLQYIAHVDIYLVMIWFILIVNQFQFILKIKKTLYSQKITPTSSKPPSLSYSCV